MQRIDYFRKLVQRVSGPLATIYACPFCKHFTKLRKGLVGVGRGYGIGQGGKLHSQMSAHIRSEHPQEAQACVDWMLAEALSWALWFGLNVGYKDEQGYFSYPREEREAAWERCRKYPFREKKPTFPQKFNINKL